MPPPRKPPECSERQKPALLLHPMKLPQRRSPCAFPHTKRNAEASSGESLVRRKLPRSAKVFVSPRPKTLRSAKALPPPFFPQSGRFAAQCAVPSREPSQPQTPLIRAQQAAAEHHTRRVQRNRCRSTSLSRAVCAGSRAVRSGSFVRSSSSQRFGCPGSKPLYAGKPPVKRFSAAFPHKRRTCARRSPAPIASGAPMKSGACRRSSRCGFVFFLYYCDAIVNAYPA